MKKKGQLLGLRTLLHLMLRLRAYGVVRGTSRSMRHHGVVLNQVPGELYLYGHRYVYITNLTKVEWAY